MIRKELTASPPQPSACHQSYDPVRAPFLLDELNRRVREGFGGNRFIFPPGEDTAGGPSGDVLQQSFGGAPIIIENSIVLDGEVISRSVNDSLGHMIDDRQRVEGERP